MEYKKYLAQMLEVAGDLRQVPAKFENPGYVQSMKKLDTQSKKGNLVGYNRCSPDYLVYNPKSNKVEWVRCVKFFE